MKPGVTGEQRYVARERDSVCDKAWPNKNLFDSKQAFFW